MKLPVTIVKTLALFSLCVEILPLHAEPAADTSKLILENLRQARPDLKYSTVADSTLPGLYQVKVEGGPTLYVTGDGKQFIAGDLFNIEKGKFVNIEEQGRSKERAELVAKVAKKDQIIFAPKGGTKAYVYVFTDIDCSYCQKLHREMDSYHAKGIEVRYLAYPRSGPFSDSGQRLATAWCAADRQVALTKLKNRESVPMHVCANNPVEAQYKLGQQIGVSGTPNMITESGELIGGYVPADELAKTLGLVAE